MAHALVRASRPADGRWRRTIVLAAAIAFAASLGTLAAATIPGSDGTVSACHDSGGNVKVIDAQKGATCPKGWTPLQWSAAGPAGAAGVKGDPGAAGASAYEIAVSNGFVGSEAAWLASLNGPQGEPGGQGEPGTSGVGPVFEYPGTYQWFGPSATYADVVQAELPKGVYVLTVSASLRRVRPGTISCVMYGTPVMPPPYIWNDHSSATAPMPEYVPLSWTAAVELPESHTVTFRCYFPAETMSEVLYPRLTAVQGTQLVTQ